MAATINSLPVELLFEIFSYLDYFGLKGFIRVNKAFNAIIKHSNFDKTLFRSTKILGIDDCVEKADFAFHPALEYIYYQAGLRPEMAFLMPAYVRENDHRVRCLLDQEVSNEQATSPAVSFLRVVLPCSSECIEVRNINGISIRQLYQALDANDRLDKAESFDFENGLILRGWSICNEEQRIPLQRLVLRGNCFPLGSAHDWFWLDPDIHLL
ncbi:hypothetical protein D6C84_02054 [Aureobasidium pullulans]|uniref:F-box domain-containing protein n=1 Tax=Aureobasidium pullulans TaxID=5580 RepID=A0A4S9Y7Y2_AURPU|nr:hypothetical protein D6C84_02054 [Aureobasidium pullulans]